MISIVHTSPEVAGISTPDSTTGATAPIHGNIGALESLEQRKVADLRPHPLIAEIYGVFAGEDALLESIRAEGILTPLLITPDGMVVAGSERLRVAVLLGYKEVPVITLNLTDPLEVEQKVLESNVARDKTNEQKVKEFLAFQRIEKVKAKTRQGSRNDLVPNSAPSRGKSRNLAAARVNWSGATAEKGAKVLGVIADRSESENMQLVEEVRTTLNGKSVEAAFNKLIELGWIPRDPGKEGKNGAQKRGVPAAFRTATTAATKLAEIVNGDAITHFKPEEVRKLREMLEPVLKWIDGFGPLTPEIQKAA